MDRLDKLEKEVGELKAEIAELKETVRDNACTAHPVEMLLRQQGLPVLAHGDRSQLVFPPAVSSGGLNRFYELMRRYSFRLFMRDLIRFPEGSAPAALTRYCSLATVKSYLAVLAEQGIVSSDESGYRLLRRVPSFGPTLEWFVCEIFRREFLAPAVFNARLQNTRHGGDFDVIAMPAGCLVYVEVKSSPPRGVEHSAVDAFLGRVRELEPHVAVLFVDTELRMRDKLVPLLSEVLAGEGKTGPEWAVLRLVNELFHVRHSIYLMNSRKGIYSNLRTCFRDFLLQDRKTGRNT